MSVIKLENVSKFYKSGEGVSVGMQKVSLEFNLGEFVAVVGESGSGKSTLLNVISGLDSYEDGELYIQDEETSHFLIKDWEKYRAKYIGFIFQSYNIIDSYTVYQNVMLALEIQNYPSQLRKARALELIDKVGLTSHKNHRAAKLSGGQKQRCVIARALAKDCPIIVADEPTGNLDSESGKQVINLLHEISKDKLVVLVTHDYDQVQDIATRKIKMHDGEVVEDKTFKPNTLIEQKPEVTVNSMQFHTLMRFALRNILSMPKRFFFFMLLQIMIITTFSLIYSNLMSSARNETFGMGFGGNYNSYFNFSTDRISDNRMMVLRKDGSIMDASDYNHLNQFSDALYVYKNVTFMDNSYVSDMNYLNVEGRYVYNYSSKFDSIKTIQNAPHFLIGGSINNLDDHDIIVSNSFNDIEINDQIKMTSRQRITEFHIATFEPANESLPDRYTWPGFDYNMQYEAELTIYDSEGNYVNYYTYTNYVYVEELEQIFTNFEIDYITVDVIKTIYEEISFNVKGFYNDNLSGTIYFSDALLETNSYGYAMSVISSNSIAAERLFNQIDKSVYRVIYPRLNRDAVSQLFAPLNLIISLFYYVLVYFFGIFFYFILFSVMKNVMSSRKKDFAIFRSIGANESKLGMLVILEQLYLMFLSFIISMVIITVIRYYDFSTNFIMQQMTFTDYIILLITFTYLSTWLARRFNKKTFKLSVIENITESKEEGL